MIFRILKTLAVAAIGFGLGKYVERALWELAIQEARSGMFVKFQIHNRGGRPRKNETPEMAGARREGAA